MRTALLCKNTTLRGVSLMMTLLLCSVIVNAAIAQGPPPPPTALNLDGGPSETHPLVQGVDYKDKRGTTVPLDVTLMNPEGKQVQLADYVRGDRPVVLQFGYYGCPMLCGLVLNGMTDAMRDMPWTPGKEYDVISVSIDPREDAQLARMMKQGYIERLGNPEAAAGWFFFVGEEDEVRRLADAAGFGYQYVKNKDEYAHPAVLIILTPQGEVSRYLPGIKYDPRTLRLSLVEASQGQVGSFFDHLLLTCFQFDPNAGKYNWHAMALMRMAGALTVTLVLFSIATMVALDVRRKRIAAAQLARQKQQEPTDN